MEYNQSFNSVDALVMATCIFSMTIGFIRGMVKEVLGILAYVGAFLIARQDIAWSRHILEKWIQSPQLLKVVNQFSCFFLALLVCLMMAHGLSELIKKRISDSIDRMTGIVFGLMRGLAVTVLFYIGSLFFIVPSKQPKAFLASKSRHWIETAAKKVIVLLPNSLTAPPLFQASIKELNVVESHPEAMPENNNDTPLSNTDMFPENDTLPPVETDAL